MDVLTDQPLDAKNSLGLSARAAHFCRATSVEELIEALAYARHRDLQVLVLGGGSNLVFSRDWPGLVIQVALMGVEELGREAGRISLRVAAGQDWPELVEACLRSGWYGLENLAMIPGTVGAAPVQNIGAYGLELSDRLVAIEALQRETAERVKLSRDDCCFGYRDSIFKRAEHDRYIITAVHLRLDLEPAVTIGYQALAEALAQRGASAPTPEDVFGAVCALRRAKLPDPAVLPNAGSFFQNPVVDREHYARLLERFPGLVSFPQPGGGYKLAAGWLVEHCGFKGLRRGSVGVHAHQALVLVNHGGATGRELLALAGSIQDAVHDTFGLRLQIEPRVV